MRDLKAQVDGILNKLKEYATQPSAYRVLVLYGAPLRHKTTIAKKLSQEFGGKYIDLLEDKLKELNPRVGLYTPADFKKDIGSWSKQTNSLLVIDEIEGLLDTWVREEQKNLFKLLSKWRTDCIILIVTRLNLPYEELLGSGRAFRVD